MNRTIQLAVMLSAFVASAVLADTLLVLDDDFDDNKNKWRTYDTDAFRTSIRDGAYHMFSPVGRRMVLHDTQFDITSDFDVSAKMRLIRGPTNYGYGIAFGAKNARYTYYFYISGDGHYQVAYFDNRPSQPLVAWKRSPHIRAGFGKDNDLRIERRSGDWIFYINGREVERLRAARSFGTSVGFGLAGAQMEVQVTSIRVARVGTPPVTVPSLSEARARAAAKKNAPAGPQRIVAVFNIEDRAKRLKKADIEQLTTYLEALIAGKGAYAVVPRATIKRTIADAKKASYDACYDESCQIELGKAVAAETIISTRIVKIGSRCAVTASVFDLQKEVTIKAATERSACTTDDFVAALDRVAAKL